MIDKAAILFLRKCVPLRRMLLAGDPKCSIDSGETDARAVLKRLGAIEFTVIDIEPKSDIRHSLNKPINLGCQFDTVFDCGTIEHVANIGQSLQTYHDALAVGGNMVISTVTDGFQTHGFYQINPQLFLSLFSQENGYETECASYRVGPMARLRNEWGLSRQEMRFQFPRLMVVRAFKVHHRDNLMWPTQPVFLKPHNPTKHWRMAMLRQLVKSFISGFR